MQAVNNADEHVYYTLPAFACELIEPMIDTAIE